MKPCPKNQQPLTALALGSLDATQAQTLRAHLESCPGCRQYFAEISIVVRTLAEAQIDSEVTASNSFHQKLVGRLRAETRVSLWQTATANLRAVLLNWRIALPTTAAIALAIVALSMIPKHSEAPTPTPLHSASISPQRIEKDPAPTFANYTMVANQSLDKLDDLLNRQGSRNPPPMYTYRVSNISD